MTYIVFPIISFFVAAAVMHRVYIRTGSSLFAGSVGFSGFVFCLGMTGNLFYGCILAALIMLALVALPTPLKQS